MRLIPRFGAIERCPLCKEVVGEELSLHVCPSCSTTLHLVCQEELGGCATLGCDARGSMNGGGEAAVSLERMRHLRGLVREELAQTHPWWGHTGLRGFLTASLVTGVGAGLILLAGALGQGESLEKNPIAWIGIMPLTLGCAMFFELFSGRRASVD
ncbi:MAG: hypothetical protein JKY65_14610 [Planctomycetes bacterium]|nr:hypothetical protein [Planctomycetota bacterium]